VVDVGINGFPPDFRLVVGNNLKNPVSRFSKKKQPSTNRQRKY